MSHEESIHQIGFIFVIYIYIYILFGVSKWPYNLVIVSNEFNLYWVCI